MDSQSRFSDASAILNRRWVFPVILTACAVAYAVTLWVNFGGCAGDSDSSGYMNIARLMVAGKVSEPQRALPGVPPETVAPFTYVPLGFRSVHLPDMVPTYPTGLPLMLAASSLVAGWTTGALLTMALQGLAGVVLVYLLGRKSGLERGWSLVGAAIVGLSPLYLNWTFQVMSDVPAMVWTTGAILIAWHARSRPGIALPLLAGFAFGMDVLIRPSDFLTIVPLAVALGISWRRWIAFVVGGVPAAVFLALFNKAAYGGALESGYQGIPEIVRLAYVGPTLWHYIKWIPVLLTPVVVLAFTYPFLSRPTRLEKLLFLSWILVFAGFYACYLFTRESWWYLRFILPAFPPTIVAALLGVQALVAKIGRQGVRLGLAAATAAFALSWVCWWSNHVHVWDVENGTSVYPQSAAWVNGNLPKDAVVAAMQTSGSLLFYTDVSIVRWDTVRPSDVAAINASLAAANKPLYAVLFPYEEEEVTKKRYPGNWTKIANVRHVSIWRRDSAQPATKP